MAEKNSGTTGAGAAGGRGAGPAKKAGTTASKGTAARADGPATASAAQPPKTRPVKGASDGAASKSTTRSAADGPAAAKAPAAKTASTAKKAGGARAGGKTDLKKDLRDFASARPDGWGHDDWLSFLEHLQSRGHNIAEREEIGRALERERLDLALEKVPGISAKHRKSLVERFGTLWSLRNAHPDEVERSGGLDRGAVDRIREHVR